MVDTEHDALAMTATEARKRSVDAEVELIAAVPRTPDQLEQDAFRLLDALNTDVADIALGATVACNLEDSIIDLLFTVEASSTAEIHRKMSVVSDIIEQTFADDEVRASTTPSDTSVHGALCH